MVNFHVLNIDKGSILTKFFKNLTKLRQKAEKVY